MLDTALKAQLTSYLELLPQRLELTDCSSEPLGEGAVSVLLRELQSCSDAVRVVRDDAPRAWKPSFGIAKKDESPRVRFAGVPLGHEFTSLVLALLHVAGHPPKVEKSLIEQIQAITTPLHFETVISLSCHNCPDVVQAVNLMAALNPNIQSTVIDGALFPEEMERRGVLAVPTLMLNGSPFGSGRMALEEILAKLGAVAEPAAPRPPYEVLVIGGGPAGAAAAVYAARKGIRTGMLAERVGGQTNDTLDIENYISVQKTTGPKFAADLEAHVREYGVDLLNAQRVVKLDPSSAAGGLHQVTTQDGSVLLARSVVIATGARWRSLNVPGEQEYKNKGVAYCPHCDGPLFKGKRVAVVGGGNAGVEAALDLAGLAAHVTVLEYGAALKADAVLVARLNSTPNIELVLNAQTTEIVGDGRRVTSLRYRDRSTLTDKDLPLAGVFVQIGLTPNTEFLKGAVDMSTSGELVVDAGGSTSAKGVFAAGDATTTPYKQIVVAAGDGAKAALSAFDYLLRAPALSQAAA